MAVAPPCHHLIRDFERPLPSPIAGPDCDKKRMGDPGFVHDPDISVSIDTPPKRLRHSYLIHEPRIESGPALRDLLRPEQVDNNVDGSVHLFSDSSHIRTHTTHL